MDVLNKFLQAEINSKEYYESIINFINLYEIRKGEFEGNEYVIMKILSVQEIQENQRARTINWL